MGEDIQKNKPGRPKTVGKDGAPRKVSFMLTAQQFERLRERAKREQLTISELLRKVAA